MTRSITWLALASGNGNAGNGGIAIGAGNVADGTSDNGNGNGHIDGVALNGGHTHQGCSGAVGKMSQG